MLMACAGLTASAGGEKTLTFVKADGTTVSFSTNGLVITYDDQVHAVINNNETSAVLDLEELNCMYFGEVDPYDPAGDVNGDGKVNIADINAVINIILGGGANDRADANGDGVVNIADINAIINAILGN